MMLIRTDTLQPWKGERLSNDLLYPKNIDALWSDGELLNIGLVHAIQFILPTGYKFDGASTWDATGQEFRPTKLIPPPTPAELEEADNDELGSILSQRVLKKILFALAKAAKPNLKEAQFESWVRGL